MKKVFDFNQSKILLIDDRVDNLRLVSRYLNKHNADVILAHNGQDGLTKARLNPPDLILLDVMMPDMDGRTVCRQMKTIPELKDIPVIFLTAMDEIEDKVASFDAGGVDYVTKPFYKEELLARVETHLSLRRIQKKLITRNQELKLAATAIKTLTEGIMITDDANRIIEVNPAFTAITGYTKDEVLGKDPSFLQSGRHDSGFYTRLWQALETEGQWQGEIWNRRKDGTTYPEWLSIAIVYQTDHIISHYIAVFSDITQRKQMEALLRRQAHYDILTGLPNRILFHERLNTALARATRYQHLMAVLYLDLDGFKNVNDTLGHALGDQVLIKAAQALQGCLREDDTAARLGGDEFAVILNELDHKEKVYRIALRILTALTIPVETDTHRLQISTSIGIALYPEHGKDVDTLLRQADRAMYQAKKAGKHGYVLAEEVSCR